MSGKWVMNDDVSENMSQPILAPVRVVKGKVVPAHNIKEYVGVEA